MLKPLLRIYVAGRRVEDRTDGGDYGVVEFTDQFVTFTAHRRVQAAIGVTFEAEGYVCVPAAIYAGNDFRSFPFPYPCIVRDPNDFRADLPPTVSNVPRMPRFQLQGTDCAYPAIVAGKHLLWTTNYEALIEGDGRRFAILRNGIREGLRYHGCGEHWVQSEDEPITVEAGQSIELPYYWSETDGTVHGELAALADLWKQLAWREPQSDAPFSELWRLNQEKFDHRNWNEAEGYYMLGDGSERYGQWQIGWVGGGISSYGLAAYGDESTRQRVRRSLDFVTGKGQSPSGFYWSVGIDGEMYSDMVDMEWGHDWHLIRRSGDALLFLSKQIAVLGDPKPAWIASLRRCAEAVQRLWRAEGKLGQFVSQIDGSIRVGETASGAIVPAGLVELGKLVDEQKWVSLAEEIADYFDREFLSKGFTNGGPGEAAQCPDSESAFALLESFIALYESTGRKRWLDSAIRAANLALTWVVPYDFKFPADSTMDRFGIHTRGSVWANVQNKHSAPGICTLSGASLWRLARATRDWKWMFVLQAIAGNIGQYLAREDRPLFGLRPGEMCERVNISDWESPGCPPGEGFDTDCWCSTSAMLTAVEVPGVYVLHYDDGDPPWVLAIDAVEKYSTESELRLKNKTKFPMQLRVFSEHIDEVSRPLPSDAVLRLEPIQIEPHGEVVLQFPIR